MKICLRKTSPSTGFSPETGNARFRFQFPGNFKFSKNCAELALLDLRDSGPDAAGFLSEEITEIVASRNSCHFRWQPDGGGNWKNPNG